VAAEPARCVEHAAAVGELGDVEDPLDGGLGVVGGLELLGDRRPRFSEEPLARKHGEIIIRGVLMATSVTGAVACIGSWALADTGRRRDLGPRAGTALADGVRRTPERFERLRRDGRPDARELSR
jgi:hypothetical protein